MVAEGFHHRFTSLASGASGPVQLIASPSATTAASAAAASAVQHHDRVQLEHPPHWLEQTPHWLHRLASEVPNLRSWSELVAGASERADPQPWWGLGIGLMIIGTVASSVGMLCFKRAGTMHQSPWYRNSWFWCGVMLFVVTAAVLDTIVFAVTPLGLIAPFAGLTIVVSFVLASSGCCGVKEPPTRTAATAVILIVVGVTVCSVFGPKSDGSINPHELQISFERNPWLYYVCATATPAFVIFYCFSLCQPDETRRILRTWMGALALALAAAGFGAVTQLQFKALASAILEVMPPRIHMLPAVPTLTCASALNATAALSRTAGGARGQHGHRLAERDHRPPVRLACRAFDAAAVRRVVGPRSDRLPPVCPLWSACGLHGAGVPVGAADAHAPAPPRHDA